LDSYWAAGGVRAVDIVTLHGYPGGLPPESICYFRTLPLKSIMAKYGVSKPMWDTEGSWGGTTALPNTDLQAAFVARHYILHWSCGVSRYYWWSWDDSFWGTLWTPLGGMSEAAIAYKNVENWLDGATMAQPCSLNGGIKFHALYTCDLTRSGGYKARPVWNTDGSRTYTAPSEFTHYRDLAGNRYAIPPNHVVPIGLKPILLENF
jgi:hypothetical protein